MQRLRFLALWGTRACLLLGSILLFSRADMYNAVAGLLGILITCIPAILPSRWREKLLPPHADIAISLYVFLGIFLAMQVNIYAVFPWWDKFLHVFCGIFFTMLGLHICKSISNAPSALLLISFALSFALAIGCLWEIYEFTLDRIVGSNAQHWQDGGNAGLWDSMLDMIANAIGAVGTAIIYGLLRKRKKQNPAK